MDEIRNTLDEFFNGDIPEPKRKRVTADELRAAYSKAEKLLEQLPR